jgi:hypothetical protein
VFVTRFPCDPELTDELSIEAQQRRALLLGMCQLDGGSGGGGGVLLCRFLGGAQLADNLRVRGLGCRVQD